MGYQTRYTLTIEPRPELEAIGRLGRVRRECERAGVPLPKEVADFFDLKTNEAIYQALFNDAMVFALGRSLLGGEPDAQWSTQDDDMRALSAAAPDRLFILDGQGECRDDRWRKYFKAGKMQVTVARIEFDPFDERKLT